MQGASMNRNAKDTVFRDLFKDQKRTFELYQVLHPEDKSTTVEDIKNIILNNILANDIYNDLGFTVGDRMIILAEAQSTWSKNIVTRMFLYFADEVKGMIIDNNVEIYSSKVFKIPTPDFM